MPSAKAIEERHELEDKVSKYTKMLHKFESKRAESTLYQLLCLRALTQSAGGACDVDPALIDVKTAMQAKTGMQQRVEMVRLRCRGMQMVKDGDSMMAEIVERAKVETQKEPKVVSRYIVEMGVQAVRAIIDGMLVREKFEKESLLLMGLLRDGAID